MIHSFNRKSIGIKTKRLYLFATWFFCIVALAIILLPRMVFAQNVGALGRLEGRVILTKSLLEKSDIASQQIIRQYSLDSGHYADEPKKTEEMPPKIVVYLNPTKPHAIKENTVKESYVIMDQKNERFVPHVLAIARGEEIRFLNSDSIYHNVFSLSSAKSFDLGRYPQGKYRTVRFDRPGIVNVYCDIHTHMNAYILVLDTPYFSMTSEDGKFILPNLPAGDYELNMWYGRWQGKPQQIEIHAGQTKNIELAFP